jgi:putative methionine-R-sulfoxide reductase with GAF domain
MQPLWNKRDSPTGSILPAHPNRRWCVRQKIHTPAYVSVDACEDGTIFGLNEIFDIGTGGLSFQNSEPLRPGARVRLSLDLAGAAESVQATGRVVWSEPSGRTGVQLKTSSLSPSGGLDQYLFLNAITACAHYEASQSAPAAAESLGEKSGDQSLRSGDLTKDSIGEVTATEFPDYAALVTCLTEIKGAAETARSDANTALQTLAEKALTFLSASGVAVAISSGGALVCRACAGSAPGLGTRFLSSEGFSGECIRSGALLHCEDAETDPRVDHRACEALGIRSLMAAPIREGARVVGLIEVFSARAGAFSRNSRIFLQRLTEMVRMPTDVEVPTDSDPPTASPGKMESAHLLLPSFEGLVPTPSTPDGLAASTIHSDEFSSSRLQKILGLGAAAALLLLVTLLMPWMRTTAGNTQPAGPSHAPPSFRQAAFNTPSASSPADELKRLRQLAEEGDATAQFGVGARYATGDGVAQDYTAAARWFSLAAEQGHVVAQATLGAYYWAGRGVPADLHKAYFWSVLAQAGGDEGSKFRLASLASSMSHGEVVRLQEDANKWIGQHKLTHNAIGDPAP